MERIASVNEGIGHMAHDDDPLEAPSAVASSAGESLASGPIVVAIGASAGGLSALKRFFETVPADTGLAFVVVVHLAADQNSYLADLLQPHAAMPVTQVVGETQVEPNHVYVIPPGRNL